MKRRHAFLFYLLWLSTAAITSTAGAGLIVNGDFESTTVNQSVPDGWVVSGFNLSSPLAFTGDPVVPPASGAWALDLGPSGFDEENGGTISQTFNVATTGTYTFRFDYTNESHNPSELADFSWFLSGAVSDSASSFDIGGGYVTFSRSYHVNSPGDITIGFTDIVGNGHGFNNQRIPRLSKKPGGSQANDQSGQRHIAAH